MNEVLLNSQNYFNIKHFSELKLTSVRQFVNTQLKEKSLHRRKNLKEALETLIAVSFVYKKMGYQKIGISSSAFKDILLCSKQTVFNFINDIKTHFPDLIKVEKKIDPTGRYRNFFEVNIETSTAITEILTEEEQQEIENLIKEMGYTLTVPEVITEMKKEFKTNKEVKKKVKELLKKKQEFKRYLMSLQSKKLAKNLTIEKLTKMLEGKANNPEFIKAVYRFITEKGKDLETAFKYATIKYKPIHSTAPGS